MKNMEMFMLFAHHHNDVSDSKIVIITGALLLFAHNSKEFEHGAN